nr:DUF1090 domain-containing protein [Halomonas sp.]
MRSLYKYLAPLCCCLAFANGAVADDSASPCSDKEAEVQRQLQIAKDHGNEDQVRGLERALVGIQENCSQESLMADAEQKVREGQEKVRDRQEDLDEALEDGDLEDIQEQREELQEAVDELNSRIEQLKVLQ